MKTCAKCRELYDEKYEICPRCGYIDTNPVEIESNLISGTILNSRYTIESVIGTGGFGIIYSAWDNLLQTRIAIKEYFPIAIANRTINNNVTFIGKENEITYYNGIKNSKKEANNTIALNEASEIINIYDYFEENNTSYIVMEYIEGVALDEYVKEKKYLDIDEAIDIAEKILKGLKKIHSAGYIHNDISPENIMICNDGKIKIIDFGAATELSVSNVNTSNSIIKHGYASPEQYNPDTANDVCVDIYAGIAVLYYMITGKNPQYALERLLKDELVLPSEINKKVPEWLDNIILHCMNIDLSKRVIDVDTIINALNKRKNINIKDNIEQSKNSKIKSAIKMICIIVIVSILCFLSFSMGEYGTVILKKYDDIKHEVYQSGTEVTLRLTNTNDENIAVNIRYLNAIEDNVIIEANSESAYILWLNESGVFNENHLKIKPIREAKKDELFELEDLRFDDTSITEWGFKTTLYNDSDKNYNDIEIIVLGYKDNEFVGSWFSNIENVLPGGNIVEGGIYGDGVDSLDIDYIECFISVTEYNLGY